MRSIIILVVIVALVAGAFWRFSATAQDQSAMALRLTLELNDGVEALAPPLARLVEYHTALERHARFVGACERDGTGDGYVLKLTWGDPDQPLTTEPLTAEAYAANLAELTERRDRLAAALPADVDALARRRDELAQSLDRYRQLDENFIDPTWTIRMAARLDGYARVLAKHRDVDQPATPPAAGETPPVETPPVETPP
jgi:hypothetical protein